MAQKDHWLPGFNFNVEEWNDKGQTYETLANCRTLELARVVFAAANREEARRPLHNPQPHSRGAAAPERRLVNRKRRCARARYCKRQGTFTSAGQFNS